MRLDAARRRRIRKQRRAEAWEMVKDFAGFACIVLITIAFMRIGGML